MERNKSILVLLNSDDWLRNAKIVENEDLVT